MIILLWQIDELISINTLIWLLPIIFFIHDGEEIITVEKFLRKTKHRPLAMGNHLINLKKNITIQYILAILLLGSFLCLITFLAIKDFSSDGKLNVLIVGIVAVILLDGIKHVGVTIFLKSYSPGVITAALVEIPYSMYTLYRFFDATEINVLTLIIGTGIALPLTILIAWIGLILGSVVAPQRDASQQSL